MPRIKRRIVGKQKESTFFTMKANPKGASVGNFVNNVKSIPRAFNEFGKAVVKDFTTPVIKRGKSKTRKAMNYKNPKYKPSNGIGVGY